MEEYCRSAGTLEAQRLKNGGIVSTLDAQMTSSKIQNSEHSWAKSCAHGQKKASQAQAEANVIFVAVSTSRREIIYAAPPQKWKVNYPER